MRISKILPLALMTGMAAFFSCKKDKTTVTTPPPFVSHPITSDHISGNVNGTMKADQTYYITKDITIGPKDTLLLQSGVKVIVQNNSTIFVQGTIISKGTKDKPNWITVDDNVKNPNATLPGGLWGGIQGDSVQYMEFRWTHIEYTGGADATGSPRFSLSCRNHKAKFILEDCWLTNGYDDGMRLEGPNISIQRNTIEHMGSTDGETINCKLGVTGIIAYNVIWSAANNGIKLETSSTILYPQTSIDIHNNTIMDGGFRRSGEPTAAILIDKFAKATIFNNIMVNNHQGLRITQFSDTTSNKGHYGNNLFYTTIDSLKSRFYPAGDWGRAQSTDLIGKDPKFNQMDSDPNDQQDKNNPRLLSTSPAIGAGNKTYNADMGAYTSDGQGNQH